MTIELKNSDGITIEVDEGESCNLSTYLLFDGTAPFVKSEIVTLQFTLYDKDSLAVINNRNAENAIDTNGHKIATDGKVTLELDASDNTIISLTLTAGQVERHVARLKWTWSDGDTTRTGIEELEFSVKKLVTPTT